MQAVQGDGRTGAPGLLPRVAALQVSFDTLVLEQREWREEQREWRADVERRLDQLERPKPVVVSERSVYVASVIVVLMLGALLAAVMLFNGRFG
jgi:cytoskeletal protein RodZ